MEPGETGELSREHKQPPKPRMGEDQQNHRLSTVPVLGANVDGGGKMDNKMIDLNANPQRVHGQTSNNQVLISLISVYMFIFWLGILFAICYSLIVWSSGFIIKMHASLFKEQAMDVLSGVPVASFKREFEK